MKKNSAFKKIFATGLLCFGLVLTPITTHAAEEVAAASTVTHIHTPNGGSCTAPNYHSHSGNSSNGGGCYGGKNYHAHSGSASSGGGCYTSPIYHSHSDSCNGVCGTQMIITQTVQGTTSTYSYKCNSCSATSGGTSATPPICSNTVRKCGKSTSTVTGYNIGCGKTTSTVESYYQNCGKSTSTIESYKVSCTSSGTAILNLSITKNVTNSSYILTAKAVPTSNGFAAVTGYKWDTGETTATKTVTENALYTCIISYTDRGVARTATITCSAMDYDTQAPSITGMTANITQPTNQDVKITITATDNRGTISYSTDKTNWQTSNIFTITQNGTYTFYVKDSSGNVSTGNTFTVSNIDKTPPVITVNSFPTEWTTDDITISFFATDNITGTDNIQYCVSEDGTLTEVDVAGTEQTATVTQNGTYYIYAKDAAGNVSVKPIVINCIDREAPVISIDQYSDDWQNKDVEIHFSATDNSNDTLYYAVAETKNIDVSSIIGTETVFTASRNGTYYLFAKDLAGNVTVKEFTVNGIDKTPPVITITSELPTEWTRIAYDVEFTADDNSNDTVYYGWATVADLPINSITATQGKCSVSENMTYYLYAKDLAGNVAIMPIVISNFDYVAPTAEVTLSPHNEYIVNGVKWVDKIDVIVTARDNTELNKKAYSFDGAEYIEASVKTYSSNGDFNVVVRDSAGNTKKVEYSLDNIDDMAPAFTGITFSYTDGDETEKTVTDANNIPAVRYVNIKVEAVDAQTGLNNKAYRYSTDGTTFTEWQDSNTFENIYLNGTYTIEVRDRSENITSTTVTISNLTEMFDATYLDVDSETGEVLGKKVYEKKLGTAIAGSELGTDTSLSAYYPGYEYINCDTATVTLKGTVVHRYFKMRYYTITFYNENGVVIKQENVPYGNSIESPVGPSKETIKDTYNITSYEFSGWVDKDGNAAILTNIIENKEYYPVYVKKATPNTYKVTFYVDGIVISDQDVVAGEDAVAPECPEKAGYLFTAWDKSYAKVSQDLIVNAMFIQAPPTSNTITTTETIVTPIYIPTNEEIEQLSNTEVVFLESKIQKKPVLEPIHENKEVDISELLKRKQIYDEDTPMASFADAIINFYTNEETRVLAITATTAAGFVATYTLTSTSFTLISGFSLTQLFIFFLMLLGTKTRCIKGAWMTGVENIKYVDKYGRKLSVEIINGRYVFKRGKKILHGVEVNSLLERLNSNKISYKEFEELIAESEVYTAFSKELEIEAWNVKEMNGANTKKSKVKGFNLTKCIKNILGSAGRYAVRITQNGKQAIFEIKYAMENI